VVSRTHKRCLRNSLIPKPLVQRYLLFRSDGRNSTEYRFHIGVFNPLDADLYGICIEHASGLPTRKSRTSANGWQLPPQLSVSAGGSLWPILRLTMPTARRWQRN